MKFRKIAGILQMQSYGDASQKQRPTRCQVGIIREKISGNNPLAVKDGNNPLATNHWWQKSTGNNQLWQKVATIHWQSKTLGKFSNNIFEAQAYATGFTSQECINWKTIALEVGLRYRFERIILFTDSKSVKVTVDAPKFNTDKFHFVPTQMMIADCLTKAMSGKDLLEYWRMDAKADRTNVRLIYQSSEIICTELDENYNYGDLSPNEQEQWFSKQSGTDDI